MDSDAVEFTYQGVKLAYSKLTGKCWRIDSRNGRWNLVTPGTTGGKYTAFRVAYKLLYLHRLVAEVFLNGGKTLTAQQHVDHVEPANGSHIQDRLCNLRICCVQENMANQKLSSRNTSGYKGVCWYGRRGKWNARIKHFGINHNLGYFTTPEEAARVYDAVAVQLFGEFALTNERLGTLSRVD